MKNPFIYILFFPFMLTGCSENNIKPTVNIIDSKDMPAQVSWNSKIYISEEGDLRAVIDSDTLKLYPERKETVLNGMHVDFYDKKQVKTSYLTSKIGRINQSTNDMYAIDDVVAVNDSSGVKLTTEELMWRNKDRKIVSDKFVVITTPTERIEGYGFESDQNLHNYEIFNVTYVTSTVNQNGK